MTDDREKTAQALDEAKRDALWIVAFTARLERRHDALVAEAQTIASRIAKGNYSKRNERADRARLRILRQQYEEERARILDIIRRASP